MSCCRRAACARFLVLTVFWLVNSGGISSPKSITAAETAEAIEARGETADGRQPDEHASADKQRRVATVAVYLFILVVVVGGLLIVVVLLWGNHLRRVARRPSPPASPKDELWYLRPKKHRPSDPTSPAASNDPSGPSPGANRDE